MNKTRFRSRRKKHQKKYILVEAPENHPYKQHDGFIPEHRLVIEKQLGHFVDPSTHDVHHIDGDVQNNELNNLQYLTKTEHRRVHAGWKKINNVWWKTCNACDVFQVVEGNFYRRRTSHNEFVSECKECLKQKSRNKPTKPPKHTIFCEMCNKKHKVRTLKTRYCSIQCSWDHRKQTASNREMKCA